MADLRIVNDPTPEPNDPNAGAGQAPANQDLLDNSSQSIQSIQNNLTQSAANSSGSSGGIGGYDPGAYKKELMEMVEQLVEKIKQALKKGNMQDFSMEISSVLGKMSGFGNEQVGATTVIMGVGTNRKDALSYVNQLIGDNQAVFKNGKVNPDALVADVNPYTGEKENDKMVPPEKALSDQITYLVNNPMSKYVLDANGNSTGKKNPSYTFFHNPDNYTSYVNQVTTLQSLLKPYTSPGNTTAPSIPLPDGFPPASYDDLSKYTLPPIAQKDFYPDFDPKDVPSADSHLPPGSAWNIHYGSIAYAQYLANPNDDMYNPSKTPGLVSDVFKNLYISEYGQQAFDELRIPPGLNGAERQYLDATGDPNAAKNYASSLSALNAAKQDQAIKQQQLDDCNQPFACTTDEKQKREDKLAAAKQVTYDAQLKFDHWQKILDETVKPSKQSVLDFATQVHDGKTDVVNSSHPATPDSSRVNDVTTALQELSGQNDTVTNTISTFLKQQTTNLQAMQTMLKNSLSNMNKILQTMVQGQRSQ